MKQEPYRPRETDHLVEPMYSGLGVDGVEEPVEGIDARDGEARATDPVNERLLVRFLRLLRIVR